MNGPSQGSTSSLDTAEATDATVSTGAPRVTTTVEPPALRTRIVGAFEVLSGLYVAGTGLLGWRAVGSAGGLRGMFVEGLFIAVGVLSVVAGVQLNRRARGGRTLSIVVLVAQLPVIATPTLYFSLFLLLRIVIGWSGGEPAFKLDAGGELFTRLGRSDAPFVGEHLVGVNLLALGLLLLLLRGARRQNEQGAERPTR